MSDNPAYYHFLSSLRRGLATNIAEQPSGPRAKVDISLHAERRRLSNGGWETANPIARSVQLYGPGDISSFSDRIVTRKEPQPNTGTFEPNYFPFVEFADPDFPWRFTPEPVAAGGSSAPDSVVAITPWLALVVLKVGGEEPEFEELPRTSKQRPAVRVHSTASLPDLRYLWRWAHVQVTDEREILVGEMPPDDPGRRQVLADQVAEIQAQSPELVVSRLMCPRRLAAKTHYRAFIVPTYKRGWAAALDTATAWSEVASAGPADLAWSETGAIDLPYFYNWEFHTSARGDFEYLVRLLVGRPLENLGYREIDCERPGFGLTVAGGAEGTLLMEGALRSIDGEPSAWGADADAGPAPADGGFRRGLAEQVLPLASVVPKVTVPAGYGRGGLSDLLFEAQADGVTIKVSWTTAEPSTGLVRFGREDPEGGFAHNEQAVSAALGVQHEVLIELIPEARYHLVLELSLPAGSTTTEDLVVVLPLPAVAPPTYGRWHAARASVDPDNDGWFDVLNLDPRHRAAAGLGPAVVRTDQEALMSSAWDQIGAIEAANDKLRRAQLGREASKPLHQRIGQLPVESALRLLRPVQHRVLAKGESKTHGARLADEGLVTAAQSSALRKIARRRGPVRKRQGGDAPQHTLARLISTQLRPAGPHPTSGGTTSICDITEEMAADARAQLPSDADSNLAADRFCERNISCNLLKNLARGADAPDALTTGRNLSLACDALNGFLAVARKGHEPPLMDLKAAEGFLGETRDALLEGLDPEHTIVARTRRRLRLTDPLAKRFASGADALEQILAYPEFPQAMYKPLADLSQALILPGVETVPPNTVGLVRTNRRFIEAYMVGLNHEFSGELLWRRFPTDQRGSYFRQFWDVTDYVPAEADLVDGELTEDSVDRLRDIAEVHTWDHQAALGENYSTGESQRGDFLVLLVRGDLLKRYPDALVYAIDAGEGPSGKLLPKLEEYDLPKAEPITPSFSGSLGDDLVFFGFSFQEKDARSSKTGGTGDGKFFVFEERLGEPRFGLDEGDGSPPLDSWSDLQWGHVGLGNTAAGHLDEAEDVAGPQAAVGESWNATTDAALRARITLQKPARLCIHADQLLP